MDGERWLAWNRFREAIFFELNPETLAAIAVQCMEPSEADPDRRLFLYEVALGLTYEMALPQAAARFDELYERADSDPGLRPVRDERVVANLPANYFAGRSGRIAEGDESRARQQQDFDQDVDQIRRGAHLGWLKHLSFIYFALYSCQRRSFPHGIGLQHVWVKSA